jgi:UPF0755 protein
MSLKKLVLILLFLCLAAGVAFAAWTYNFLTAPREHSNAETYIVIPKGSSTNEIFNRLAASGVIGRAWPLRLYVRLSGLGPKIKAGEYRFPSPISPLEVVRKLEEGEQRLSRLTVVEGWTRWDIASLLARIPELRLSSSEEALALLNDPSLVRDLDPAAQNLEGYLFPDTYSFPPETTPQTIVRTMVERFRKVWGELNAEQNGAPVQRSTREIVTIASLIETEAKLPEERPLVASVIYNRLQRGMALGIDSSVIYASKLAGKWRNDGKVYMSDLERVSPYNTRKVLGLPPGPIASPGQSSLAAALRPAQTDYLYYVREPSRNDGAHNFYSTEAEFQRGVQALREWERSRNANAIAAPPPSNSAPLSPSP